MTEDAATAPRTSWTSCLAPRPRRSTPGFGFRPVVDGVGDPEVEGANDPADPFPAPEQLYTVDGDFGGWGEAADKFFADGEDGGPRASSRG